MLSPHECLDALGAKGINQKDIGKKVGANQSSISRIQRQLFTQSSWRRVERIQSLYQHVCIDNEPFYQFPDFDEYMKSINAEQA